MCSSDLRREWACVFSSARHGKSFAACLSRVTGAEAPTLLLIRDDGGAVFGGFAPQPWAKRGAFYGDGGAFVFSLSPAAAVYPSTGINANYQWCGAGFSELPNGLGFGGQVGHCAVFVDDALDAGVSRPSATFANPALASGGRQAFAVAAVECWALQQQQQRRASDGGGGGAGATVMDRFAHEREFLGLAGAHAGYSEGVRHAARPEDDK